MSRIILILFFGLFAVMHLADTKIPPWVLGAAAGVAAVALILEGVPWTKKGP